MIRSWPRFQEWLADDRDDLRTEALIRAAAAEWDAGDRSNDDLYRSGRLESALDWRERHGDVGSELAAEFIDASHLAHQAEIEHEARRLRRLRMLVSATAVALVLALIAGLVAVVQRSDARAARDAAELQAFVAVAGTRAAEGEDPALGMLLAAEAHARAPGAESVAALFASLVETDGFLGFIGHDMDQQIVDMTSELEKLRSINPAPVISTTARAT